jgi:hypothetical protein
LKKMTMVRMNRFRVPHCSTKGLEGAQAGSNPAGSLLTLLPSEWFHHLLADKAEPHLDVFVRHRLQ